MARTSHPWSVRRTIQFLLVAELLSRLSISGNPAKIAAWVIRPSVCVALLMEALIYSFIVVRGRSNLAQDIPTINGIDGLDGRYYLFAFALIPVLLDVTGLIARLLSNVAMSGEPHRYSSWIALGLSAVQVWFYAHFIPRSIRSAFALLPLCAVVIFVNQRNVALLSGIAILADIAVTLFFLLVEFLNISRKSRSESPTILSLCLRWCTALTLGFIGGIMLSWLITFIHALESTGGSQRVEFPAAGFINILLRPGVTQTVFAFGAVTVLVMATVLIQKIMQPSVLLRTVITRRATTSSSSALSRRLFPVVGGQWVIQKLGSAHTVTALVGAAFATVLAVSFHSGGHSGGGANTSVMLSAFDPTLVIMVVLNSFMVASSTSCLHTIGIHTCRLRLRFHAEQQILCGRSYQNQPHQLILRLICQQWIASGAALAMQLVAVFVIILATAVTTHQYAAIPALLLRVLLATAAVWLGAVVSFHCASAIVANMRQGNGAAIMTHALLHCVFALVVIGVFQWNEFASLGVCLVFGVWSVFLTYRRIKTAC